MIVANTFIKYCNCVENTFACPTTTNTFSSCVTYGQCSGYCHACLAAHGFNYIASHVWMTCFLLRYVSQHSSSCRLAHHFCTLRTVSQWCITSCQQKAYQIWLFVWSKGSQIWQNPSRQAYLVGNVIDMLEYVIDRPKCQNLLKKNIVNTKLFLPLSHVSEAWSGH